ncbi:MAG: primosomal protein N', partial [Chloroflexi bacterium]|nr:primosomal protein N' [Chloroflexota bacterium]
AEGDSLPRAPRQRQALEYLAGRAAGNSDWVPLAEAAEGAGVSPAAFRALAAKGLVELSQRQVWRDPLAGQSFVPVTPPELTPDQEAVWRVIARDLEAPQGRPFLLQGVTGSGKTEIYLRAVQRVLAQGRSAIVLVPEIALTPQTIRRFGARFPATLAVWHSRLSAGERYDQWQRMRSGELRLVVGSRSALFSPVRDLGLIILDEEHESSYKQPRAPRYHARDVALRLTALSGATCLLGSATPALESAYRAERGEWVHLVMPRRVMAHRRALEDQARQLQRVSTRYQALLDGPEEAMYTDLPPVEVVDMRAELRAGNRSIFSRPLKRAMDVALAAGEQIILFLNRRGDATFILCRDCGYVLKCPRCDVPLTYHSAVDDLICHHCNYITFLPPQCPSCWGGRIRFFGLGTQRVERIVNEEYPQARVVRWDLDTTGGKMDHERILDRFIRGEADIMIGTQMIAKGLDLPRVTLVGVITADTMINLPDLRAGERTFQLLTQVAGRAGRSILGGRVIVQTYAPEHPAVQAARTHDYEGFYRREIAFRREHWYPPMSQLVRLIYVGTSEESARRQAERLYRALTLKIARLGLEELGLIGPAPAFFPRLRGKWRWHIVVRGKEPARLLRDMQLPLGWRVDVDPVSLL